MHFVSSRGRMIFTGILAVALTSSIILFVQSGPHADPRVRIGAAIGILASITTAVVGAGVAICLAVARHVLDELQAVRRDCDLGEIRLELREVIVLQRRTIDEVIHETERQMADWPPVPAVVGDDGTGPFPAIR
jgi:hypothetical protein